MPVALVLVSHSADAARGVAEIARQMAPDVRLVPVGGDAHGGLGTDLERVLAALEELTGTGGSVAVLGDLGSAVLTAESTLEMLDDAAAGRVRVVDGPFLEGAVAGAVRAQQGGDLEAVCLAAAEALGAPGASGADTAAADPVRRADAAPAADAEPSAGAVRRSVVLRDPLGLHARPAAVLARAAAGLPARVRVAGADATSMLELMRLGTRGGDEVVVEASGPGAEDSVAEVVALLEADPS